MGSESKDLVHGMLDLLVLRALVAEATVNGLLEPG